MKTPEELRAAQRENQNYFSGKVGELSRNIGFGLSAVGFALISTDSKFYTSLPGGIAGIIIFAAALGCLTVLIDYLQYFFGWMAASDAANNDVGGYSHSPVGRFWRKCQDFCFYAKQVLAVLGAFALIFAVVASRLR
jgi:hypothetical protein